MNLFFKNFIYIIFTSACIVSISAQNNNSREKLSDIPNENSVLFINLPDTSKLLWFKEQCWKLRDLDKKRAYEYGLQALDIARDINNSKQETSILNYLGVIQRNVGNNNEALEYFNEALSIARSNNIVVEQGYALNNIGNIYHLEEQYENALQYIQQAALISKKLDNQLQLAYCYHQIGSTMQGLNNIDSALYYFSKALAIREKAGVPHVHVSLITIADLYHSQNDNKMEEKYLLKSLALSSEISIEQFGERQLHIRLGKLYFTCNRMELAKKYFSDYLKKEAGKPSWSPQRSAAQYLTRIFKMENNPGVALKYSELSSALSDSIIEREARNEINKMTLKYKFRQEKAKLIAKQEEEEVNKKIIVHSLSTGLFLIILFLAAVFRRHRIQKKINIELEKKNKLILSQKEKLEEYSIELKESNQTKDRFFSIIAHDLRSPFNSILGFSEEVHKKIKQKDFIDIEPYSELLYKSAKNTFNLLTNLLEWSRSQTGAIRMEAVKFLFNELISETVETLRAAIIDKNISMKFEFDRQMEIVADKDMLHTILRNLLSNACKFSNTGGDITIYAKLNRSEFVVSVKDTGVGIEENCQEKLFSLDTNYSTCGTKNEKGTGLGLILCKELVEKHSGKIWVESEYGYGTTFSFSIPQ